MSSNYDKKNKDILGRYGIIVSFLLLFAILILITVGKIIFTSEGKKWRDVGKKESIISDRIILPKRGNIFTHDGKILATSEPLYGIYMDFRAGGMKEDSLKKYIDDLSVALAKKFPDRSAAQYKNIILGGWKQKEIEDKQIANNKIKGRDQKVSLKSRYIRIIQRDISYIDLKELRTFPFFSYKSNINGLIAEEKNSRKRPFGNLANRTVGNVYKDLSKGGASGIELKYDSLLRGVEGVKSRRKIEGRWTDIEEVAAKDGYDIITTLDADIQDITERALRDKLIETSAESGTAIIMETKTGEIKGIANLDILSSGGYAEGNPNAFSYMNEPGSTFKTITVMIALDDGVIVPTDSFHVGSGLYQYKGKWVRDHYWRQGNDRGYLTVKEGMELSSNIVMSKIVLSGYENNPDKFVKGIDRIGLRKSLSWDVPLNGIEGTSSIRFTNDKTNLWSKTTLPWMSFGYETRIPPIYLLMYYNGIANNGKMIKPFIAKKLLRDGRVLEEYRAEVVNSKICKESTLEQIQEMLVGVVEEGTAKVVGSNYFQIAGKTGTALIASGGGYSDYYVSFCGYFPADDPQYTCFVGIRRPRGVPSGGGQAGMVFKNIAEQTFVRRTQLTIDNIKVDSLLEKKPIVKNGNMAQTKAVMSKLKLKADKMPHADWVTVSKDSLTYIANELAINEGYVPKVIGMGAKDALYLLESSGLIVSLSGSGKVISQSITPGEKVAKGRTIKISLL